MPTTTRRAARRAARLATCLLTATPDEAALLVALALPTALDRLRLALVCRRYGGWRSVAAATGAAAADGWSVAEESARCWLRDECSAQERGWAPREGGASWLGLMWRVERLRRALVFTSTGGGVELSEEGTVATRDGRWQSAVCAEHPMVAGVHYVEMSLLKSGGRFGPTASPGLVGQGFDAAGGGEAYDSAEGWLLVTYPGVLYHAGRASKWQGMPQPDEIKPGDVVGLLLDLGQRTLSMYLNGARRGVMVAPGMKNYEGRAVGSLVGPLRWVVDVGYGASVRIARRPAPGPVPSAEEVAAAVAWNEANHDRIP